MNYEAVTEIGLIAGVGFFFLAVLLFFALEIPALLREMRGRRGKAGPALPEKRSAEESAAFSEAAETMLLGGAETGAPGSGGEPAGGDEWKSFRIPGWEIAVCVRRRK